jgi:hypothetical protein
MKTARTIVVTAGVVLGLVLLLCLAMWGHMAKQAKTHHGNSTLDQMTTNET